MTLQPDGMTMTTLTDEQISDLIHEWDGGHWIDGEFRIDGKDLMNLCRAVALLASAEAAHPVSVLDQLPEHDGTAFESYEFSDGVARNMTRPEFDKVHGQTLRIHLERARENRRLNRVEDSYRAGLVQPRDGGDPEEPLTCDFCGAVTDDPWHTSSATEKHLHQCDACHAAPAQSEPLSAATEGGEG